MHFWIIVGLFLVYLVVNYVVDSIVDKGAQGIENAVNRKKNERLANEIYHLRDLYPEVASRSNRNAAAGASADLESGVKMPVSADVNLQKRETNPSGILIQMPGGGLVGQKPASKPVPEVRIPGKTDAGEVIKDIVQDWKCHECGTVNLAKVNCCRYCGNIKRPGRFTLVAKSANAQRINPKVVYADEKTVLVNDPSLIPKVTLFCRICGAPNPETNTFCMTCGAKL